MTFLFMLRQGFYAAERNKKRKKAKAEITCFFNQLLLARNEVKKHTTSKKKF